MTTTNSSLPETQKIPVFSSVWIKDGKAFGMLAGSKKIVLLDDVLMK